MPELPDLVVFAENLTIRHAQHQIDRLDVSVQKILDAESLQSLSRVAGKKLQHVEHRGKQLVFIMERGVHLWVHLMLHGELRDIQPGEKIPHFICASLLFSNGSQLAFCDRTQWMKLAIRTQTDPPPSWASSGLDPLSREFTDDRFRQIAAVAPRASIKTLLMDQRRIAGIGNAFADEILWAARIHPLRKLSTLKPNQLIDVKAQIVKVLVTAIESIRESIQGRYTGEVRGFLSVHRKRSCPRCGSAVHYTVVNGRGTYFCPVCQN